MLIARSAAKFAGLGFRLICLAASFLNRAMPITIHRWNVLIGFGTFENRMRVKI